MWKSVFITFTLLHYGITDTFFHTENSCNLPLNDGDDVSQKGTCIFLDECNYYSSMWNTSMTAKVQQLLRNSLCGFENKRPKVCCPPEIPPTQIKFIKNFKPSVFRIGEDASDEVNQEDLPNVTEHANLRLLPPNCGNVNDNGITSDAKTGIFDFPWMALIGKKTGNEIQFVCTGSIINSRYLLTSAQCITNISSHNQTFIRVGDYNIKNRIDCEGSSEYAACASPPQDIYIQTILPHPEFDKLRLKNDIALVRLAKPIDFSQDNVQSICLPLSDKLRNLELIGANMTMTGWGVSEYFTKSDELLKTQVYPVTNSRCSESFKKILVNGISHKQLCLSRSRKTDSCNGDTGGPLMMINDINGVSMVVQYGVVDLGNSDCDDEVFAVFTNILLYMDWILDQLED
ncbi:phenoloxidase-activating factor 3-like [Arctopsyche grandis]|uniref:phenoloxidase-activating factor 3-like n=1 Tax=Arctopsyche grandis TaxID=121162 RepID=UPI00406D6371